MITELPKHLTDCAERETWKLPALRRWANMMAAFYDCPIWLCGSAMIDCNSKPRDWDVRVEMPEEQFVRRFGDPKLWEREASTGEWTEVRWKWADECVKQTKNGWENVHLNIDFQIYPEEFCVRYCDRPKARLDTRPDSA